MPAVAAAMPAFVPSAFLGVRTSRTPPRARCASRPVALPRAPPRSSLAEVGGALAANPAALETLSGAFKTLGMPVWLVQWGHPAMMGFMVLGMGVPGAAFGWAGRLNIDKRRGVQQKQTHENIMLAFVMLAALGGFGGTLSVAMQGYDVWESAHAKSAAAILAMLVGSAVFAYTGFALGTDGSPKARLTGRKVHAYFGTVAMSLFLVHAYLGVKILLE
jgi:Protein of unknown function (DUF4079)